MKPDLSRTAAVVVHYRNYPAVLDTVSDFISAGVDPRHIIVVDNSEDAHLYIALRDGIPSEVLTVEQANFGYGGAANTGIEIALDFEDIRHVAVSSHEVRLSPGSIEELASSLQSDSRVGAVGPILRRSGDEAQIWSTGGATKFVSRRPYHLQDIPDAITEREWLDGAFVMYNADALRGHKFDLSYFLYYEETDLHFRLRKDGWKILVDPRVSISQDTSGAPPFYVGRNSYIFMATHFSSSRALMVSFREFVRFAVRGYQKQGRRSAVRSFIEGLEQGRRIARDGH